MKRLLGTLALSAFLLPLSVVPVKAADHDQRIYDREYKTYHVWNADEDRAYHRYWAEQHHQYRGWKRLNNREQAAYWHWRHEHPDEVRR